MGTAGVPTARNRSKCVAQRQCLTATVSKFIEFCAVYLLSGDAFHPVASPLLCPILPSSGGFGAGGYFTANTQIEPPCGTSGYLPGNSRLSRPCMRAASTPQPDWTAMYCLPSTWNETGTPLTPEAVGDSPRIFPVLASNARNMRSLVPPANRSPPPVASTGPQFCDGSLVVHTRLPASRSQACSSPKWSAPLTMVSTFLATPV